jgi:hypothetical protein
MYITLSKGSGWLEKFLQASDGAALLKISVLGILFWWSAVQEEHSLMKIGRR